MKRLIPKLKFPSRLGWSAATAAWAALLMSGFAALSAYEFRQGKQDAPPTGAATALADLLGEQSFHLAVALHPKCPCSRASVAELERLVAECDDALDVIVLVAAPTAAGDDWLDSPMVREIRERLHARIVHDAEGALASRLGMHTSGAVVLLDDQGQTKFFGGITASRGHEGDNVGKDAICNIIHGQSEKHVCSPVFGCPLVH